MAGRLFLGIGATFLVAVMAVLGFLSYERFAGGTQTVGGPFALVDGDGRTVTDADFRGEWMLVYFGYTHCPDACPTALTQIVSALDKLPPALSARIRPIFITVDPARDTPAVMKDYVAAFSPRLVGLTGSAAAIGAVEKSYRVYAARRPSAGGGYAMDHSSIIYLMGPDGRYRAAFSTGLDPSALVAGLEKRLG